MNAGLGALDRISHVVVDNHDSIDRAAEVRLGSHISLLAVMVSEVQFSEDARKVCLHPIPCVLLQNVLPAGDDMEVESFNVLVEHLHGAVDHWYTPAISKEIGGLEEYAHLLLSFLSCATPHLVKVFAQIC